MYSTQYNVYKKINGRETPRAHATCTKREDIRQRVMGWCMAVALLMALPGQVMAQQLSVRAPSTVASGQHFRITFNLNARGSNFEAPNFGGLRVLSGPHMSSSSSTSIINGNVSREVNMGYEFIVQAEKEGAYTVGAARCKVDNKTVSSEPFTIRAEKSAPQSNAQQGASYGQPQQRAAQQASTIDNNSLFARASVNKTNPYQGEEVILTYSIYTQISLQNFQLDKLPGNKGFWSEDLSAGKNIKMYDKQLNDRNYRVAEIRRGAMFAQESGKLTIEPLELDVLALVQTQRQRTGTIWDLFDDPFFNPTQAVERHLKTNAITVNVRPLPTAPQEFCGGVGRFDFKAQVDNDHVRANEAITYKLTISGHGNLMLIDAPTPPFSQAFEVYDPKVSDNITRGDAGISGSRTFEWVLIPRTQGSYSIPEYTVSYFDPAQGHYVSKTLAAIPLEVEKGDPAAMRNMSMVSSKSDVKVLNSDINHIKTGNPHLKQRADGAVVGWKGWLLMLLPLVAGIVAIVIGRKRQALHADEKEMRLRRATKLARKRLRAAHQFMEAGDDNRFYEEIYKALWGCLSDKYGIELSQLSRDTVEQKLQDKKVAEEQQQRVMAAIEKVDLARFAPGDASATMQHIYDEILQTIVAL
ncbi:MAG: protein BatD [Bacteroidales bacterium]|nr:protein BatD [Bacteroidales bacterium]